MVEKTIFQQKRNVLVDFLAICFGIGAWVSINGLWVELPLMVEVLPEGWNLPSYLTVIIQLANIGPILYGVLHKCCGEHIKDSIVVYGVLLIGCGAAVCLPIFWNKTAYIFGSEHSVYLFILVFFLSLVDCTSSVLFMPFMVQYQEIYLTSYLIGEGLSGFLPSIFALAQGVGGNPTCVNQTVNDNGTITFKIVQDNPLPRFGVDHFFYILFAMMIISGTAYCLLNVTKISKNARAVIPREQSQVVLLDRNKNTYDSEQEDVALHSRVVRLYSSQGNTGVAQIEPTYPEVNEIDILQKEDTSLHISNNAFIYILVLQTWIALLSNGVFPSIQSYSSLPYGNIVYHLSATLSSMASPLVCFIAYFLPSTQIKLVSMFTLTASLISCYIMATAALSPSPPLVGDVAGDALVTTSWILFSALFTYAKVSIATICRMKGHRALFLCGAVTQLGSAVGSFLMFFLVNNMQLFKGYSPC